MFGLILTSTFFVCKKVLVRGMNLAPHDISHVMYHANTM